LIDRHSNLVVPGSDEIIKHFGPASLNWKEPDPVQAA